MMMKPNEGHGGGQGGLLGGGDQGTEAAEEDHRGFGEREERPVEVPQERQVPQEQPQGRRECREARQIGGGTGELVQG